MKLCTRKFLAGLLSFGMLLQVASPLSALAAEAPTAKAELTINISSAADQDGVTYEISQDSTKVGEFATVSCDDGTYTIKGMLGKTIDDVVVISGVNGSTPSIVVENNSTAIAGDLIAKNLNNVKIHSVNNNGVHGSATVDCTGDVLFQANGNPIMNDLTVTKAHDVTVIGDGSYNTVDKVEITCTGDILIKNTSTKNNGGIAVGRGLTVYSAEDVTISSSNSSASADWNATIRQDAKIDCTGDVLIENTGDGHAVTGNLIVNTPGDVTVSTSTDATPLYTVGKGTIAHARITANALTISNASADSEAELIPLKFAGCNGNEGYTAYTKADRSETINVPTDDVATIKGNYLRIEPGTVSYGFSVNGTAITSDNLSALPDGLTYDKAANKLTASKDITGDLSIMADSTNTTLDVALKSINGSLTIGDYYDDTTRAQNLTIDGTVTGNTFVCVTGDITVNGIIASEQNGADDQNRLDTTTGKITVTSDGAVWGQYASVILKAVNGPVIVSGCKPGESLSGPNLTVWATETEINNPDGKISAIVFVPQCPGDYYINKSAEPADRRSWTSGQEAIFSEAVDSKLVISQTKYAALTIAVTGADGSEKTYSIGPDTTIIQDEDVRVSYDSATDTYKLSGGFSGNVVLSGSTFDSQKPNVVLENDNGKITSGTLTVTGVNDFNASSIVEIAGEELNITADGDVILSGMSFIKTAVKSKSLTMDTVKSLGDVTYTTPSGNTYTPTEEEANGTTLKLDASTVDGSNVPGDDAIPDTDPGSTAGGAVAAVVVGGAAILGGYEITTRVILHNILPEGAAIPANRGQLALLIWNNADRPEPANEPVFADVADADMAKAAQWCVEQGIMDAKAEDTFKPEGWTPKFKVIETWNKAFPAAK